MSGTYEFYNECKKADIKPIVGQEFYFAIDRTIKEDTDEIGKGRPNYHMILLAKDRQGYECLSRLSSEAYSTGFYYSPRIDNELLKEHINGHVIGTTACIGSIVNQYILKGDLVKAEYYLTFYKELFGDGNFFLELQVHNMEEQLIINEQLLKFSKILNLPIIITSDSHYLDCCDKQLHDKFLCIATNSKLQDPKRFSFKDLECHLPLYDEILQKCLVNNIPLDAINNTNYIADMINPNYFENQYNNWPRFPKLPNGITSYDYLCELVFEKWQAMFPGKEPTIEEIERIQYELKVIKQMDFSDYMLIIWDICEFASNKKILMSHGRGSVSGSLVAFVLGITKVNPLKYGLIFPRFINEGRASIPIIFEY